MVGGHAPSDSDGLTIGYCAVDGSLSWGHHRSGRDFLRKIFCVFKDSDLNESTILWWRFSAESDQTVDPHHKRECVFKV